MRFELLILMKISYGSNGVCSAVSIFVCSWVWLQAMSLLHANLAKWHCFFLRIYRGFVLLKGSLSVPLLPSSCS